MFFSIKSLKAQWRIHRRNKSCYTVLDLGLDTILSLAYLSHLAHKKKKVRVMNKLHKLKVQIITKHLICMNHWLFNKHST